MDLPRRSAGFPAAAALAAALWVPVQEEVRGVPLEETTGRVAPAEYARRHALVIGVDEYAAYPGLVRAVADARAIREVLVDRYGFEDRDVRMLLDSEASKSGIEEALEDWAGDPDRVGPEDLLVVFFAGHGETREIGERSSLGYLVPVDARKDTDGEPVWSSLVAMRDLGTASEIIPAKHVLFVLDCCFGGLLTRSSPVAIAGMTNRARQILTAGNANQPVLDDGGGEHSVFTRAVLDALEGAADRDGDEVITFGELYDLVGPQVESRTQQRQTPIQATLPDHEGGNVAFFEPGALETARRGGFAPADWHRGPPVVLGSGGPARFVPWLYERFSVRRTLALIAYADRFYRAPANDGFEAVLDRIERELRESGFGSDGPLRIETFESEMDEPAWNPRSAELALLRGGEEPLVLHAFRSEGDRDRVMLPIGAPACDVQGPVVRDLKDVKPGTVLLIDTPPLGKLLERARALGALAVVSSSHFAFVQDPSGGDLHLDAIQFRIYREPRDLPVAMVSPRTLRLVRSACEERKDVELRLRADVELVRRPLRTLVATIVGARYPERAVVLSAHVDEPGACDNAAGAAAMAESARLIAAAIAKGELERPASSVVFVWGKQFQMVEAWFEQGGRRAIAGIASDSLGNSPESTGSMALLERSPDPGSLLALAPDEHTAWGEGAVAEKDIRPDGLAVIARSALLDVASLEGSWRSAEHPWEGGGDHDVFISRGIPAFLFWHFEGLTYHTSLDRLEWVDGPELRRNTVAILSAALAVADPRPDDLPRYMKSLAAERKLRVAAADREERADIAAAWNAWCDGAGEWLRLLCTE